MKKKKKKKKKKKEKKRKEKKEGYDKLSKLRWSGLCEGEGVAMAIGCQAWGRRFASSTRYAGYSESLRTVSFWCSSFELHVQSFRNGAAYGVFMQTVEARRERVFRDRGNPLDALNDSIEFYSRCRFRREELNPAIEPHTERNAAISSV